MESHRSAPTQCCTTCKGDTHFAHGRKLTNVNLPMIVQVTLSSMPQDRRAVFLALKAP